MEAKDKVEEVNDQLVLSRRTVARLERALKEQDAPRLLQLAGLKSELVVLHASLESLKAQAHTRERNDSTLREEHMRHIQVKKEASEEHQLDQRENHRKELKRGLAFEHTKGFVKGRKVAVAEGQIKRERLEHEHSEDRAKLEAEKSEMLEELETFQCCVCKNEHTQVVFRPCSHMCVCKTCSLMISSCPLCRTDISDRIFVFT